MVPYIQKYGFSERGKALWEHHAQYNGDSSFCNPLRLLLLNADSVTHSNKASSLISSSGYLKLYEFQIKRILIY